MTKTTISILTAAALLAGCQTAQTAGGSERYGKQKVVYHITDKDPAYIKRSLGNIQNHINAVGRDNIDLKVVMNGDGLDLLAQAKGDKDLQSKVSNLKDQGTDFEVCNNTLTGRKINYKADLYDVKDADIVPSGVAEAARLQQMGYVYIKP
jgi:intracellular sulfur oxidation DsrE/DsrF family protein